MPPPGWYDDGAGRLRWYDGLGWTDRYQDAKRTEARAANAPQSGVGGVIDRTEARAEFGGQRTHVSPGMSYVVLRVILKERLWGKGGAGRHLTELEAAINAQTALGYRLHTITTAVPGGKDLGGGDRIQATMVFERIG